MKTNKIVLLIVGITLCSFLAISVFADPSDGLIKINKQKHIARDSLIDGTGTTSGWVTFACQSLDGLEYSVSVKGLDPSTTYTVRAESLSALWAPFPPFFGWIPTSDGGARARGYSLHPMVGRARDVIGRGIQEGSNQDSTTHA